jgi:hypothetical protein
MSDVIFVVSRRRRRGRVTARARHAPLGRPLRDPDGLAESACSCQMGTDRTAYNLGPLNARSSTPDASPARLSTGVLFRCQGRGSTRPKRTAIRRIETPLAMADELLRRSGASPRRSDPALARSDRPRGRGATCLRAGHRSLSRANAVPLRRDASLCARGPPSQGETRVAPARRPRSARGRRVRRTREPYSPPEPWCDPSRRPSSGRQPRRARVRESLRCSAAEHRWGQPTPLRCASFVRSASKSNPFAALRPTAAERRQGRPHLLRKGPGPNQGRSGCRRLLRARRPVRPVAIKSPSTMKGRARGATNRGCRGPHRLTAHGAAQGLPRPRHNRSGAHTLH